MTSMTVTDESRAHAAYQGPVRWNPSEAAFRADPYPFYDRLRAEAPVYVTPDDGTFVVTRFDDVGRVLRSADVSRDIEANARIDESNAAAVHRRDRRVGAKTILNLDPPDHTRLRRLASKAFTPSAVERLRAGMISRVDAVLDTAAAGGSLELIDDLAFPFPFEVISELLGMPTERALELREWSMAITLGLEPQSTVTDMEAGEGAVREMIPYLLGIIDDRRANPGDDVLSALLAVEDDGDTLDAAELLSFVVLLYVAGHETTVNLIGNGTLALLRHPSELARWRANPDLDAVAVDELMRFDGPVQHTVRVAMRPIEFEGHAGETYVAEPGQLIVAALGSANHDPAMFATPGELRLDRPNAGRHLGFSAGIHYCLGASLAKMEATIAIGRLIRRFGTIEMAGEPHWRDRITIRGVDRLELLVR